MMKSCILLLTLSVGFACAADSAAAKKAAQASKPKAARMKMAGPLTIPPAAVEASPGMWRWTDPAGKNWRYTKTPFGVSRTEETPETAAADRARPADDGADVTVKEDGDVVHFERQGPFGKFKWTRPKLQLNETEQKALDSARSKGAQSGSEKQE